MSGQRSSIGHHRCVTPLYRIPMWSFNCVMLFVRKNAKKQSCKQIKAALYFSFVVESLLKFFCSKIKRVQHSPPKRKDIVVQSLRKDIPG